MPVRQRVFVRVVLVIKVATGSHRLNFQSVCARERDSEPLGTKGRQVSDRDYRVHAISTKGRIEVVQTVASRGRCRNDAATRFACFLSFAVSLAFLAATSHSKSE